MAINNYAILFLQLQLYTAADSMSKLLIAIRFTTIKIVYFYTEKMACTHRHRTDPACSTQGKWPALDGRRTCTVCVPFQSVLRTHRGYVPVVKVSKRTEMVCNRCKYGIRLEHAGSVLCPCVRAIFPVLPPNCSTDV